jgi:2-polyprenyl-3-methyl-5-hydroxy-6-metoxy-1,4-benzoquinol methylase
MSGDHIVLESRPCPLGCPSNDEPVLVGRDRIHNLPGEFLVVRCRVCGLMRTDPRPTPETIGFYYPDTYGPYQNTRVSEVSDAQQPRWERLLRQLATRLIELNIDRVPRLQPGRMLEIGCASGAFLHRMAGEGWQVEGIEFGETAADSARSLGHPVYTGTLESAPDPEHRYDLIVGWMVLEHLHDPVRALQKLHSWIRPGGWLAISVPNAGSFEFSIFKNAWFALQLPNHLYHYTPETLAKVLEMGHWNVEKIFHQRDVGNLVNSFGYAMADRKLFPGFAEKLIAFPRPGGKMKFVLLPLAYLMSIFGQTGRMTIWAKRKDD